MVGLRTTLSTASRNSGATASARFTRAAGAGDMLGAGIVDGAGIAGIAGGGPATAVDPTTPPSQTPSAFAALRIARPPGPWDGFIGKNRTVTAPGMSNSGYPVGLPLPRRRRPG